MDRVRAGSGVVFGAADGLVVVLGLVMGMVIAHQSHSAVWHAALSGGLAEFAGMSYGKRKSDGSPWHEALLCGTAALGACIVPAVPYLLLHGSLPLVVSGLLMLGVAWSITALRPEGGWLAVAETFGVLLAAGALTVAGGYT